VGAPGLAGFVKPGKGLTDDVSGNLILANTPRCSTQPFEVVKLA